MKNSKRMRMNEVYILNKKTGLEIIFKFFKSKRRQDIWNYLKRHIRDLKNLKMHLFCVYSTCKRKASPSLPFSNIHSPREITTIILFRFSFSAAYYKLSGRYWTSDPSCRQAERQPPPPKLMGLN